MKKFSAALAALALVAGVGVFAAQAATSTTYFACLKGGTLSSVGIKKTTCPKGSSSISWGSQGPVGARGPAGPSSNLEIQSEDGKTTVKVIDFGSRLVQLADGAVLGLEDENWYARHVVDNGTFYYAKPNCVGPIATEYMQTLAPIFSSDRGWELHLETLSVFGFTKQSENVPGLVGEIPPGFSGDGLFTVSQKAINSFKFESSAYREDGEWYCDSADGTVTQFPSELIPYEAPDMGSWDFKK